MYLFLRLLIMEIEGEYYLEKFQYKGGWTYILLHDFEKPKTYFGMLKAEIKLDGHDLGTITLMPFGNGKLFFPVNAKIRKLILKEAGDKVQLELQIPSIEGKETAFTHAQVISCIKEEPVAWKNFQNLPKSIQENDLNTIISYESDEKRVEKIVTYMEKLKYL
ncbi:DUF1905 domain-containing protein [Arthrospiribacter ruber]|uniref:DUF1905 domain-containing protein n=2 Tax=Arthrospiribacter ruber TaxID=2487934 RepID=A0A951MES5_9BACT|nr:DUF1905 domain-containing protein [Arthrospiribacter ruber]